MYEEVIVKESKKSRRMIKFPCIECGKERLVRPSYIKDGKKMMCQPCAASKAGKLRKKTDGLWIVSGKTRARAKRIFCKECNKEILVRLSDLKAHKGCCFDCNAIALGKSNKGKVPWNKGNKEFNEKEFRRNRNNQERWEKKKKIISLMGDKCAICGFKNLPICVYQWHHKNPEIKTQAISQMLTRSWKDIKEEMKKCDLVCANCHRIEHYGNERLKEGK